MNDYESKPERLWASEYGEDWTEENYRSVSELDELYLKGFGSSRLSLLDRFVGELEKDARVLEVGANAGMQLTCLKELSVINFKAQREGAIEREDSNRGKNVE